MKPIRLIFASVAALLPPAQAVEFATDIRPLLEVNCIKCHGADKQKGDLRLDALGFAEKGGETGQHFSADVGPVFLQSKQLFKHRSP